MREPDLFFNTGTHDRAAAEYLNDMFSRAAVRRAADIHMLYEAEGTTIQYGISGSLHWVDHIDHNFAKQLDEKLRARANIAASDRHKPLDGRLRLKFPDRAVDVRVSILPTLTGQKIVCRLMDNTASVASLDEIEMTPMARSCLEDILQEPNGLFLVCGPTGSGKSTTLYAALQHLNNGKRNILTLEQPVEKVLPGLTQVNINQHISFAEGLRAALRQAPHVILVGEIRDVETAMIAIQAANTGHLVVATVHANNSAMAITRLLDMGVDVQTLADALRGVLSQRLVEILRPDPERGTRAPTEAEVDWMEVAGIHHAGLKFPAGVQETDYEGRMPVMELIRADAAVRAAMLAMSGEMAVFNAAMRQSQFETMAQAVTRMAAAGLTSIEKAMQLDRAEALAPETKRVGQVLVELGHITPEEAYAAAVRQIELRKGGKVRRLGQILVEEGICTAREVIRAVGYTQGAPELVRYFITTGKVSADLAKEMETRWRQERTSCSLFDLYIEHKHLTEEDFNEPSLLFFNGRRVVRPAADDAGTGVVTGVVGTAAAL
jgi:general secretion pathway protein E